MLMREARSAHSCEAEGSIFMRSQHIGQHIHESHHRAEATIFMRERREARPEGRIFNNIYEIYMDLL
jgi:hypothetical protein